MSLAEEEKDQTRCENDHKVQERSCRPFHVTSQNFLGENTLNPNVMAAEQQDDR
jgi:hypothetical protein